MATYQSPYSLRMPDEMKEKIRYIAKENKRSMNREIEQALEQYIRNFEKKNGAIDL